MNSAPSSSSNPLLGILLGCGAFFMFAVMQAAAKWIGDVHDVFEISFYRSIISLIPFMMWMAYRRPGLSLLKTKLPKLMAGRVLIGIFGLTITFQAVMLLPIADATLVFMTAVLITPIFAHFFLNEHSGPHRWGAIFMGLIGVILILEPSGKGQVIGYGVAFAAALTHASTHIILRKMKDENPMTILFYFFAGGGTVMLPFVLHDFTMPNSEAWLYLIIVGLSGGLAQLCLTNAFKYAQASLIAPFSYTGLMWAALFDIVVWGNMPGVNIAIGAVVIIAAQGYIIHREKLKTRQVNPEITRL